MDRSQIIAEIRRTTQSNGGAALGFRRFERETGIKRNDWEGRYWVRWSDAVREAGCEPASFVQSLEQNLLIRKLVELTQMLERVPTQADTKFAHTTDAEFPSEKTFRRLGRKHERAAMVVEYCQGQDDLMDVLSLWQPLCRANERTEEQDAQSVIVGYVYLAQHGSRQEYKIGKTNNVLRREGELRIELPLELRPVHYITTDDPSGVEAYWHRRFEQKHLRGEWYALTSSDVKAFKRWKRVY